MRWHNVNNAVACAMFDYQMNNREKDFSLYIRITAVQGMMLRTVERLVEYTTEDYVVDPGGRKVRCDWRKLDKEEDVE